MKVTSTSEGIFPFAIVGATIGRLKALDHFINPFDNIHKYRYNHHILFQAMAARDKGKKLLHLMEKHLEDYATFDTETGEMIKSLTDIPVNIDKEGAHMCNAMKELLEESRNEGIKEGLREGEKAGILAGRKEGMKEGRKEGYTILSKSLLNVYPHMTAEEAKKMARELLLMEE